MFKKTTLDTILSDFTKTISKLETLIAINSDKIDNNLHIIEVANQDNDVLIAEATKADSVKKKLLDLVG